MIPKIIHYCWFGRNPKPKLAKKCIKSWKKYCSDYDIIEWNEDNFDISTCPLYVRQAYEAKKWAFVTDYVRLWAMTQFGGIYMDTDVELVKPLDAFLKHEAFSGFEDGVNIPTGIMACRKGFPLFLEFLHYYDDVCFLNDDESINYMTNVTIMTNICLTKGLVQNGEFQIIDGFVLYPKDVFCPVSYHTGKLEKTKNTVAIHWFAASWHSTEERKQHKERIAKIKKEDRKDYVIHIPNRVLRVLLGSSRYEKLKKQFKKDNNLK